MATSGASEDAFSGRPNYVLRFQVNRLSASGTTNRWRVQLQAIKRSGATSFDLTSRSWSVSGGFTGSGSWVPDFRNTDAILLWAADINKGTDSDGYSNINWTASAPSAGLFGSASTSGGFTADRIPQRPGTPPAPYQTGNIYSTSFTVTMPSPADDGGSTILDYNLVVDDNNNFVSPVYNRTIGVNSRTQTITGLQPNTTYYVRQKARNSVGSSEFWSGITTIKTGYALAGRPTNPHTQDPGPGTLTMDWDAPVDLGGGSILGYVVQMASNSAMTASLREFTVAASATALVVDDLMPSTTYWFRVMTVNQAGRSEATPIVSGTTISGAYVSTGTAWRGAAVFVSTGTSWVPATLSVSSGTVWIDAE